MARDIISMTAVAPVVTSDGDKFAGDEFPVTVAEGRRLYAAGRAVPTAEYKPPAKPKGKADDGAAG